MNKKSVILLIFTIYTFVSVKAQLSTNEKPVSFGREAEMMVKHKNVNSIVTMPRLDMAKIEKEDREDEEYDMPPRFGYSHNVNYNTENSGTWFEFPNGDKLWQLNVICPGALSVNFCYDKFWIPDGGKFFVYSKDKKFSIGAFTSKNNKGDRNHLRGFATGLVFGNDVILEYYQPKDIKTDAVISIDFVVHGYRFIKVGHNGNAFDSSGCCMVNINCEEGQEWQNEKKAVAMILVNGERVCTGSLINTTSLCQTPLFLTANHCLNDSIGEDALKPDLPYYSFYWNYESPGCLRDSIEPSCYSTSGATILANNKFSDFALFRLAEDPINIPNYTPYYLGWDNSGDSGDPGVCIHHPRGDVKKISTVASKPVSTGSKQYFWQVSWKSTLNGHGTTEFCSSGSPLLTADHKVIGQLQGGTSSCSCLSGTDKYGKFSVSWTGTIKEHEFNRRLDCWLDSLGTGVQALEGLLIVPDTCIISTNQQLYSHIRITGTGQLNIQSNVGLMGNSRVIVEAGGKLIIDGGTLSNADLMLKAGASLQIINGGVIETRSGFAAPEGALVNIENGKIM